MAPTQDLPAAQALRQESPSSSYRCLLFDCDNTLVLSEDAAFEACAEVANEVLASQHIPARYTSEELMVTFMGQKFRGMLAGLQKMHNFTLEKDVVNTYCRREEEVVIANLEAHARPCRGSVEVLSRLHAAGQYKLAVVSSSALPRIHAALRKAGHDPFFGVDSVFSASSSLSAPAPKPDPAIYLHAMARLGVGPEECVTVEDSMSGAGSAIRANVPCIGYVGAYGTIAKRAEIADALMALGCRAIMWDWDEYEGILGELLLAGAGGDGLG